MWDSLLWLVRPLTGERERMSSYVATGWSWFVEARAALRRSPASSLSGHDPGAVIRIAALRAGAPAAGWVPRFNRRRAGRPNVAGEGENGFRVVDVWESERRVSPLRGDTDAGAAGAGRRRRARDLSDPHVRLGLAAAVELHGPPGLERPCKRAYFAFRGTHGGTHAAGTRESVRAAPIQGGSADSSAEGQFVALTPRPFQPRRRSRLRARRSRRACTCRPSPRASAGRRAGRSRPMSDPGDGEG
jgi:hypothetical protein